MRYTALLLLLLTFNATAQQRPNILYIMSDDHDADAISLTPILTGKQKALNRPYLYYHFYEYKADHTVLEHLGIRGERYKLIYFLR